MSQALEDNQAEGEINSKKESMDHKSYNEDENISDDGGAMENGQKNGDIEEEYTGQQRKRERRSKDDVSTRNYVCGCGKSYLSYAA